MISSKEFVSLWLLFNEAALDSDNPASQIVFW
jgi:hypothetical protein